MTTKITRIIFTKDFSTDFTKSVLPKLNSALITKEYLKEYFAKLLGAYNEDYFNYVIDRYIKKMLIYTNQNNLLVSPVSLSKVNKISVSNRNVLEDIVNDDSYNLEQPAFNFYSFVPMSECFNYSTDFTPDNIITSIVVNNDQFFVDISNVALYSISGKDADNLAKEFSDYTTVSKKDTLSYFYEIAVQVLRVFCMSDGTSEDIENYKKFVYTPIINAFGQKVQRALKDNWAINIYNDKYWPKVF